ncbi:MAG: hypothetical protein LBR08_01975 [Bacteroidales bacterium]|jgi:hypothetical protein|nr:hypothetical protein [Bacteroidales bacterium]
MFKKFFLFFIIAALFIACDDKKGGSLQIIFENDRISDVFPGDKFYVKGKIQADNAISSAFYFHQKKDATGRLDESGNRLELASDGSFSLEFTVEAATIGVKIIAEDAKENRLVRIFEVIQGVDGLEIVFEDEFINNVNTGETFHVKGVVNSKTRITGLSYTTLRGQLISSPEDIPITNDREAVFDIPVIARSGMTGVSIRAVNIGELDVNKLFEVKNVTVTGPVVLFDRESISVKPDSSFTVSGSITSTSGQSVASAEYIVARLGGTQDAAQPLTLTGGTFNFPLNAGETVASVTVKATDSEGTEGEETIPVNILFPSATIGNVMIHYKNIILTDAISHDKSYFCFDVAPYVLNAAQALENYEKFQLLYTNLFISGQTYTGPALFSPNVATGGTVKGNALVADWPVSTWGTFNVGRLQAIGMESAFTAATGKTFNEIGDTQEEWDALNTYLYNGGNMGGSGIIRQVTTIAGAGAGWMFRIGWGGNAPADFTHVAVGIVRSFGGTPSTYDGESTGAWLEIEIKKSKNSFK